MNPEHTEPILNLVSPPPSREEPIPFETLVEAARLALPADMPRDPTKILVAVDLDGTVLLPSGPSPRVREMMAEADRAGLQTVVATGRSFEATAPVLHQLGDPQGWTICSNGAVSVQFDARQGVVSSRIRTFDPTDLIDLVVEGIPDALIGLEVSDCFLLSGGFPPGEFIETHRVHPVEELRGKETIKLVIRAPEMDRDDFQDLVDELGISERYECSVGWTSWADVLPLGVTKASGLHELAETLGIGRAGTVAIGDGTNDVPMIRWANFGVVMGGASQIIKAEGDHVTGAVENDGAAAVIRALLDHCGVAR